jgi:uncharacterized protein
LNIAVEAEGLNPGREASMENGEWRNNLVTAEAEIADLLARVRRIAVLGIKPASRAGQPAHYVPRYLQEVGYDVVPVPVYYPEVTEILGQPIYRDLRSVPGPIDMVNVFRRPVDIPPHVEALLAAAPEVVWFQLGIRHAEAAERLARAGIRVVQDRCSMIDHRRFAR